MVLAGAVLVWSAKTGSPIDSPAGGLAEESGVVDRLGVADRLTA